MRGVAGIVGETGVARVSGVLGGAGDTEATGAA